MLFEVPGFYFVCLKTIPLIKRMLHCFQKESRSIQMFVWSTEALLFQSNRVQFLAPTLHGSQLPGTPAPGDPRLSSSGLHGLLYMCGMYIHMGGGGGGKTQMCNVPA